MPRQKGVDLYKLLDPNRELDWRFRRAKELAGDLETPPRQPRYTDDAVIRRLRKFLINSRRYTDDRDLFITDPELHSAHRLYRSRGNELRWYLEARILCGMTDDEIAAKIGVLPEAVDLYEKCFYHVRDNLGFHDWTYARILGPRMDRSTAERAEEIAAKLVGYFGGPLALDAILTGMPQGRMVESPDQAADYLDEVWASTIRKRSVTAARAVALDAYNVMQIFEIHGRIIDTVRAVNQSQGGAGSAHDISQRIFEYCRTIPWKVGPAYGEEAKAVGAMFQKEAVDLRTDQLLQLTTDQSGADFQHLTGRQMRPPRPKDESVLEVQPPKPE